MYVKWPQWVFVADFEAIWRDWRLSDWWEQPVCSHHLQDTSGGRAGMCSLDFKVFKPRCDVHVRASCCWSELSVLGLLVGSSSWSEVLQQDSSPCLAQAHHCYEFCKCWRGRTGGGRGAWTFFSYISEHIVTGGFTLPVTYTVTCWPCLKILTSICTRGITLIPQMQVFPA